MLRQKYAQARDFIRTYVFDWQVLAVLAVPMAFCLLFPIFWLVLCPVIWERYPDFQRPRTWMISYWLFASIVWMVFLLVSFCKTRSTPSSISGCHSKSESTEDLWSEDQYLPEEYLPTPDYPVSVTTVQPEEEKRELDETWDYDYEESSRLANSSSNRFPVERHYGVGGRKYSEPFCHLQTRPPQLLGRGRTRQRPHSVGGPHRFYPGRRLSSTYSSRHLRPVRQRTPSSEAEPASDSTPPTPKKYFFPGPPLSRQTLPPQGSQRRVYYPPSGRKQPPQFRVRKPPFGPSTMTAGAAGAVGTAAKGTAAAATTSPELSTLRENLTAEELRSLEDVHEGRVARKDSLVTDEKFDSLLASLHSLASELEKDFEQEGTAGMTDSLLTNSKTSLN